MHNIYLKGAPVLSVNEINSLEVTNKKLKEQLAKKTAECERLKGELELETGISYMNQDKLKIATEALNQIKDYRLSEMGIDEEFYKDVSDENSKNYDEDETDTILNECIVTLEQIGAEE